LNTVDSGSRISSSDRRKGKLRFVRMDVVRLKLGMLGCGCIGSQISREVDANKVPLVVSAVCDAEPGRAESLADSLDAQPEVCSLDELPGHSDIVLESASGDAVPLIVEACIGAGTDILVMSVGGLLQRPDLFDRVRDSGIRIEIPSGALAGLDAVRAANEGEIRSVMLVTRKPPAGLRGAPYLQKKGVDVDSMSKPMTIFDGPATEAVRAFPQNVNVAAALSFAGIGPERTRVRVIADPTAETNTHEIVVEADCGRIVARTENRPSPANPRTSHLAVLSALYALRRMAEERSWRAQCTQ